MIIDFMAIVCKSLSGARWLILIVGYSLFLVATYKSVTDFRVPFDKVFYERDFSGIDDEVLLEIQREQLRASRRHRAPEPKERDETVSLSTLAPEKDIDISLAYQLMGRNRFLLSLAWLLFSSTLLTLAAEKIESKEFGGTTENFTGGALFVRYGHRHYSSSFSVSFEGSKSRAEVSALSVQLRERLAERLKEKIPSEISVTHNLEALNLNTNHKKTFLRILALTARQSLVADFVHFDPLGHTFTAHYMTYSRGPINRIEFLRFILESPVRIWFWYFKWKLGSYSILSKISTFDNDSFDLIELGTRYQTISELIWDETKGVFREFDLLTPEIEQMIVNNFASAQQVNIGSPNSQVFSVSGAAGATITQIGSIGEEGGEANGA